MAVGWRGGDVGVVVYDVKINNRLRVSGVSIKKNITCAQVTFTPPC